MLLVVSTTYELCVSTHLRTPPLSILALLGISPPSLVQDICGVGIPGGRWRSLEVTLTLTTWHVSALEEETLPQRHGLDCGGVELHCRGLPRLYLECQSINQSMKNYTCLPTPLGMDFLNLVFCLFYFDGFSYMSSNREIPIFRNYRTFWLVSNQWHLRPLRGDWPPVESWPCPGRHSWSPRYTRTDLGQWWRTT